MTIHAGEVPTDASPMSVKNSIDLLHARRIGHGLHVMRDTETVGYTRDKGIVYEICPNSNVLTNAVPSLAAHPVRAMIEAGLKVKQPHINRWRLGLLLFCSRVSPWSAGVPEH